MERKGQRFKKKSLNVERPWRRETLPSVEDCSALAFFEGFVGDGAAFAQTIERAKSLSVTRRDHLLVILNRAEGLALLGQVEEGTGLVQATDEEEIGKVGLSFELV